jgi:hypothetical protein
MSEAIREKSQLLATLKQIIATTPHLDDEPFQGIASLSNREAFKNRLINLIDFAEGAAHSLAKADDFYAKVADDLALDHHLSKAALGLLQENWGEFTDEDRAAYRADPPTCVSDWLSEQRYAGGESL